MNKPTHKMLEGPRTKAVPGPLATATSAGFESQDQKKPEEKGEKKKD